MASENDHWYVGTNKDTQGAKTKTGKGSVNKDPLPYEVKIKSMEAVWPGVAGHIVPESSMLTLASRIYDIHGGDIDLIAYTDEAWILRVLEKYNGQTGPHGYYDFNSITTQPTPRLSSATDVRAAVLANDREAFTVATGVDAGKDVSGTPYFDLVAKYLGQVHESTKIDKYIQHTRNRNRNMENINHLRKLAGLPLLESVDPASASDGTDMIDQDIEESVVDYYADSDKANLVRKIGMALANLAVTEKDDEESNRMSKISQAIERLDFKHGDPLEQLLTRIKLEDPQVLVKYLKMGMDGVEKGLDDVSHVDDRKKGAQGGPVDQEEESEYDDFEDEGDATKAIDDMEDYDLDESPTLNLSDILEDYGISGIMENELAEEKPRIPKELIVKALAGPDNDDIGPGDDPDTEYKEVLDKIRRYPGGEEKVAQLTSTAQKKKDTSWSPASANFAQTDKDGTLGDRVSRRLGTHYPLAGVLPEDMDNDVAEARYNHEKPQKSPMEVICADEHGEEYTKKVDAESPSAARLAVKKDLPDGHEVRSGHKITETETVDNTLTELRKLAGLGNGIQEGDDEFKVDGETYKVKEEMDEGVKCEQCGSTDCECAPGECDPVNEDDQDMTDSVDSTLVGKKIAQIRQRAIKFKNQTEDYSAILRFEELISMMDIILDSLAKGEKMPGRAPKSSWLTR